MLLQEKRTTALNGVCPYFTMFPLDFPLSVLSMRSRAGDWVLDPFCGRGTTNYAARLCGLFSTGIDSHPVASAVAEAKLANALPADIVSAAEELLADVPVPHSLPEGPFWSLAYHPEVLTTICRLREGLLADTRSDARRALRAILLGALHGPRPKSEAAYFSNQAPRTYAPKPRYAVKFWTARGLYPQPVDVLGIIAKRAYRYFGDERTTGRGTVLLADSSEPSTFAGLDKRYSWVITSPPYYGMRTYLPDQWLRLWFLGNQPTVDYSTSRQLEHTSPSIFADQLHRVWINVGTKCTPGAHLVIRFGAINDRNIAPIPLLMQSLQDTGWTVTSVEPAGSAARGRRQALHFSNCRRAPLEEYDVWCVR